MDILRDSTPPAPHPTLLLNVRQAAAALAVGRTTVYELIAAGDLDVVRIGRAVRIPVDSVERYVDRHRTTDGYPARHFPASSSPHQERRGS